MRDSNLDCINKFLDLYYELLSHDGYGDITVNVRLAPGNQKEIRLFCGREFRFLVPGRGKHRGKSRYRVMREQVNSNGYKGPERRSGRDRRSGKLRRLQNIPRNFKLERRVLADRRSGYGRRRND